MTCQGISLGLVSIGCCFFLSVTRRGLLFFLHTECRGDHGFSLSRIFEFSNFFLHTEGRGIIFFITNYRIIEYLSHGMSRRSRIFFVPNFFLVPNFRIVSSHGRSRSVTDFFVPRLVLGPTDQREVIAEFLSITRSVADGWGACSSCEWGLFVVVYRPIRGVCV